MGDEFLKLEFSDSLIDGEIKCVVLLLDSDELLPFGGDIVSFEFCP